MENSIPPPSGVQNDPLPKKKSRLKLWLWLSIPGAIVLLALIAIAAGPWALGVLAGKDIPKPDTADLKLSLISVPDPENAYFDLAKLADLKAYQPDSVRKLADGTAPWDKQAGKELVEKNSAFLGIFDAAANKPRFQIPLFSDPEKIDATSLSSVNWRLASELNIVRAKLSTVEGNGELALSQAMKSVSLGQKIQDSQSDFLVQLIGMSMKNMGLRTMQDILRTQKTLQSSVLKKYSLAFSGYDSNTAGLDNAIKMNYFEIERKIDSLASGQETEIGVGAGTIIDKRTSGPYFFKPNQTKKMFADWTRGQIEKNKSCGLPETNYPVITNLYKLAITENRIGKLLYTVLVVDLGGAYSKKCEEIFLARGVAITAAVAAYQSENGSKPIKIPDLVPNYLSKIPIDPFDSNPIRYNPSKGIIYSVGRNLTDDGGVSGKNSSEGNDLVLSLEQNNIK